MTAVTTAPPRHQCPRCQHFERRGGAILPASDTCRPIEDSAMPAAAIALLQRTGFDLAARGRCPNFLPFPKLPDAYRSEDLPR
jgi:hypothetical protein